MRRALSPGLRAVIAVTLRPSGGRGFVAALTPHKPASSAAVVPMALSLVTSGLCPVGTAWISSIRSAAFLLLEATLVSRKG